ncbi:MAG: plasmid mobilization relaxosome protein MobC [Clostridia bacterium]
MANRERNSQIHFMVTPEEKEMIEKKMELISTHNMGAYIRKMVIDGYVIKLEIDDIKELIRLLRISSNNLNQLSKRANETGNIYYEDIEDLKESYNKLWKNSEEIINKISEIL